MVGVGVFCCVFVVSCGCVSFVVVVRVGGVVIGLDPLPPNPSSPLDHPGLSKSETGGGRGKKKRKILGTSLFGARFFLCFWAPPFKAMTHTRSRNRLAKIGRAKTTMAQNGLTKIGLAKIGQMMAKTGLAKVGQKLQIS